MVFLLSDGAQKHLSFLDLRVRENMFAVITQRNTHIHYFLDLYIPLTKLERKNTPELHLIFQTEDPSRLTQASQFLPHQATKSRFKHRSCLKGGVKVQHSWSCKLRRAFWSSSLEPNLHSHSGAVQKHGNAKNHQCFLPGVKANYRLAFQELTGDYTRFCLGFSHTCRHTECKKAKEGTHLLCNLPQHFFWQNKSQHICHLLLKMWFQTQHFSLDQQEGCVYPLSISRYIKISHFNERISKLQQFV